MVFSPVEIIKLFIGTLVAAIVLKDSFKLPTRQATRVHQYTDSYYRDLKSVSDPYNMKSLGYAFLLLLPSIGLHEVAHKIVGLALGFSAVIDISTTGLLISLIMKYAMGFTLIVPAYVVTSGFGFTYLDNFLISAAGPLLNLITWQFCKYLLLSKAKIGYTTQQVLANLGGVNRFLFFFNIIPLPMFDGGGIWTSLIAMLFGL